MKIVLVHPHDIFSKEEPWTVRIRSIAEEFVKRGHKVRLIYFPLRDEGQHLEKEYNGYFVIPLSRQHGPHIFLKNIRRVIAEAKWCDIIHFQKCFHYAALPVLLASFITGKPVHYDWDDWEIKIYYYPPNQSRFIGFFLNSWETSLPCLCDTVSYSSYRLKEECERLGVKGERMCQAHVGADITKFRPDVDGSFIRTRYCLKPLVVLYLGQLHGGQYTELYLRAAREVLRQRNDVSFLVVGGGYRQNELIHFARHLQIDRDVVFTGYITHDESPYYIAAADVCVACFEDNDITRCKSPLKIVEYLASGKAIVASNVGEVRNMVGGIGVLVPPGDSQALAQGIVQLLNDGQLRREMSCRARERAEHKYNWGVTAQNLLEMYGRSLNGKG
ncbi:MAG: glycosyltransferase family 4 protein [Candidatus Omnitrophica bacterium]|nr:glycosyltransferase family 4 protein [Candidatus Omnitrophota bacterium]